jgi:GGDEF domain-containing protein
LPIESVAEFAVWSAMAGAIVLLIGISCVDLAWQRSLPAARGLAFVLLTGAAALLITGWPQALMPSLAASAWLPLQAAIGPLSSALALSYLGIWASITRDDRLVRAILSYGCMALVLAGTTLGVLAFNGWGSAEELLGLAGLVNAVSVVLGVLVAIRAATLGDALARWMSAATVLMASMVAGLYAKALEPGDFGWVASAVTALSTVAYFLMSIVLVILRSRQARRTERIARGQVQANEGLGLPGGEQLVTKVDDALWRSARFRRECVVAAVNLSNLYEPSLLAGPSLQPQILQALAARIRQYVGFRNVVGMYHPRCFILVVSAVQDPRRSTLLASRLLEALRLPVRLESGHSSHDFEPQVGMGVVRITGVGHHALRAINKAEQLATQASQSGNGMLAVQWDADHVDSTPSE